MMIGWIRMMRRIRMRIRMIPPRRIQIQTPPLFIRITEHTQHTPRYTPCISRGTTEPPGHGAIAIAIALHWLFFNILNTERYAVFGVRFSPFRLPHHRHRAPWEF